MIYAIGVGPGDPNLITLKALEILRRCDCVYAFKWADEVLRRHGLGYVELKYGNHRAQILEGLGKCGNLCVAFTGDPAVSEWELVSWLMKLGEVELVPGVSSVLAAFSLLKTPFDKVVFLALHRSDANIEELKYVIPALEAGFTLVLLPRPWDIMLPHIAAYLKNILKRNCIFYILEKIGVDNKIIIRNMDKINEKDITSDMAVYVVKCE